MMKLLKSAPHRLLFEKTALNILGASKLTGIFRRMALAPELNKIQPV